MVLVLYLFPGPLLRPKKSPNVFSGAIKDAQTTVLQCHVLVTFFFTAQTMMPSCRLLVKIILETGNEKCNLDIGVFTYDVVKKTFQRKLQMVGRI